jgi:hypothetical protein
MYSHREVYSFKKVELFLSEIFNKVVWELGTESLGKELQEILLGKRTSIDVYN